MRFRSVNAVLRFLFVCSLIDSSRSYKVPDVTVEPLAKGFRVSMKDEEGLKSVAFHVNRNRKFTGFEEGQFSIRLRQAENGFWQHDFERDTLRAQDTIYVWTSVQQGNGIYRNVGPPLEVCQLSGDHLPSDCRRSTRVQPQTTPVTRNYDSWESPTTETSAPTPSACVSPSETLMSPAAARPLCKGQLIFEEEFEQLSEHRWLHEVRAPLDTTDAEFVLYDGKARVDDGKLIIEPKLWSDYRPDLHITNGRLDLSDRCTGTHNKQKECVLSTGGPVILPPVVVPRISTKESFAFRYGRIDIRARLPKGDWLVPLLLLEPLMEWYGQTGYESGQLRVAMIRANNQLRMPQGKLIDGRTLLAGAVLSTNASLREDFMIQLRKSIHFGEDYHIYSLNWTSKSLRFSIDGQEYGELLPGFADSELNPSWHRGGQMAPFDRMFYISLGLSVGGFGDFLDNLRTANVEKPWLNKHPQAKLRFWQSQAEWFPTWKQPKLLIDYVRVYAI